MNRDKLNSVSQRAVRLASMAIVDALQDHAAEVQPLAAAAVFLLLADHYRTPAQDLFAVVTRVMKAAEGGRHPEFKAVEAYIRGELKC